MKDRQNNNTMLLRTKTNTVRKTLGDDTPNVLANNGELERLFRCQRYATVNFGHELKCKTGSLALIPCTRFDELSTGSAMKNNG